MVHVLNVLPGHAMDTADGGVCQDVKGGGREVEGPLRAAHALVDDGDGDGLALVCARASAGAPDAREAPLYSQLALIFLPQAGLLFGLAPL